MTSKSTLVASQVSDREHVFIGGQWVESAGGGWIDVVDPWSEQTVARVRSASQQDVERAVAAARTSFDSGSWASRTMTERATVIEELANRLEQRIDDLTTFGVLEVGWPVTISGMSQQMCIGLFRSVADIARQIVVTEERPRAGGGTSRIVKEPTGVVAAIIPWNSGLGSIAFKVATALAAGCSVVLKAAPEAPLSPALFADTISELVTEGMLPAGVVSVLAADREVSETLVTHPHVDHITFTGSTAAGRRIMALAGEQIKRVSLELGGKSAAIILDDADLDEVMGSLPMGGCMSSGQACTALTRVLVSRERHDEFISKFKAALSAFPMGDPWDQSTILGPLAMERQRDRVEGYIASAVADGATIVLGGGRPSDLSHGYFIEPTVLDDVRNTMRIAQEEVFGPVISVITYEDEDDAVAIANDSIYGLSGAVYTKDPERGFNLARRIRTGVVSVNTSTYDLTLPFGGYKQSGLGREGGVEGLEEFFELKTVHMPA